MLRCLKILDGTINAIASFHGWLSVILCRNYLIKTGQGLLLLFVRKNWSAFSVNMGMAWPCKPCHAPLFRGILIKTRSLVMSRTFGAKALINPFTQEYAMFSKIVLTARKNCSNDQEKLWNLRLKAAENIQNVCDQYRTIYLNSEREEQFLKQNDFFNLFLVSYLIIGIWKPTGKFRT